MCSSIFTRTIVVGFLLVGSAAAQQPAESAAREQLKQGFALRKAGQCREALPHFIESFQMVPLPKTLLNLADCEEHLGQFVDAAERWRQAHDLAEAAGDAPTMEEAAHRLEELLPRVPRLTITLTSGAPASAHVLCDGIELAADALGVPRPSDAGRHTIEVRADGYEPKVFDVAIGEREALRLDVEPGPKWAPVPLEPSPSQSAPPPPSADAAPPPRSFGMGPPARDSGRPEKGAAFYLGLGAGALGAASLSFGLIEGLTADGDHKSALQACNGACQSSMSAQHDQAHAYDAATLANVGFVAGGVLVITSLALLIVPRIRPPSGHARTPGLLWPALTPLVGQGSRGVALEASW
jgi:hypothetical protein